MGYRLRREVRDALPPGLLTAAERLLVLEIADLCNDDSREGWPGAGKLADLTDLSERSIQETLNRIGRKWLELRVALGKSDTGKVYYSHAGKRTTFRFPPLSALEGATDRGASGATDPGAYTEQDATDPGGRCDGSVEKVRQIRGPSPQGTSLKINTSPPPTPSAPGSALAVVEAEIVEEGADLTSSFEIQLQELIEEIRQTRPNWPAANLRTYINAAVSMLGESFEAAAEVARRTAKDATTAHPSRIIASGNPHLKDASTAFLLARIDSADPTPPFGRPHPNAHPFEADGSGISCQHCGTPVQNGMHKVGNQSGGYIAQRASPESNQKYVPYRNPPDQSAYLDDWQAPRRTT